MDLVTALLGWFARYGDTQGREMDSSPVVALMILKEPKHREPFCRAINEEAVKQGPVRSQKVGLCTLIHRGGVSL